MPRKEEHMQPLNFGIFAIALVLVSIFTINSCDEWAAGTQPEQRTAVAASGETNFPDYNVNLSRTVFIPITSEGTEQLLRTADTWIREHELMYDVISLDVVYDPYGSSTRTAGVVIVFRLR